MGCPFVFQQFSYCGPAALESVLRYYGFDLQQDYIAEKTGCSRLRGTTCRAMLDFPRSLGLHSTAGKGTMEDIFGWLQKGIPVIALIKFGPPFFKRNHFVVIMGYSKDRKMLFCNTGYRYARGIPVDKFRSRWVSRWMMVILPPHSQRTPGFNEQSGSNAAFTRFIASMLPASN